MQESQIIIVNGSTMLSINMGIESAPDNSIIAILNDNAEIASQSIDEIIVPLFNDPKIGFVYTDLLVKNKEAEFIRYHNGIDLFDIPFFLRKIKDLKTTNEEQPKIGIMASLINLGYYFQHIADPLIVLNEHTIYKEDK